MVLRVSIDEVRFGAKTHLLGMVHESVLAYTTGARFL